MDTPARDRTEQNIKRANEKQRKWNALQYKGSKARNLHGCGMPESLDRVPCCDDKEFEQITEGRFRKTY